MAIFLDTGFFTGLYHPKDEHHEESVNAFRRLSTGEFGLIYASPFIIAETATLMLIRTNNNQELLQTFYNDIYGSSKFVGILPWSPTIDEKTWVLFKKYNKGIKSKKEFMSFIDISSVIYCQDYRIEKIVSYDRSFENFLARIV